MTTYGQTDGDGPIAGRKRVRYYATVDGHVLTTVSDFVETPVATLIYYIHDGKAVANCIVPHGEVPDWATHSIDAERITP